MEKYRTGKIRQSSKWNDMIYILHFPFVRKTINLDDLPDLFPSYLYLFIINIIFRFRYSNKSLSFSKQFLHS